MKPVSDQLFSLENDGAPVAKWERCSAKDLGLAEHWLRDEIFKNPELVIGPCRAAGITDDDWYAWHREYKVADAGRIDVLSKAWAQIFILDKVRHGVKSLFLTMHTVSLRKRRCFYEECEPTGKEMGSDFVISLFCFCGPRPDSFPTNYVIKCPGK